MNPFRSSFGTGNSIITAVMRLHSGLTYIKAQCGTFFDLFKAFHSLDHCWVGGFHFKALENDHIMSEFFCYSDAYQTSCNVTDFWNRLHNLLIIALFFVSSCPLAFHSFVLTWNHCKGGSPWATYSWCHAQVTSGFHFALLEHYIIMNNIMFDLISL